MLVHSNLITLTSYWQILYEFTSPILYHKIHYGYKVSTKICTFTVFYYGYMYIKLYLISRNEHFGWKIKLFLWLDGRMCFKASDHRKTFEVLRVTMSCNRLSLVSFRVLTSLVYELPAGWWCHVYNRLSPSVLPLYIHITRVHDDSQAILLIKCQTLSKSTQLFMFIPVINNPENNISLMI